MEDFMKRLEAHMRVTKTGSDIPYPIEVAGIKIVGRTLKEEKVGSWVSVRPCAPEHESKTFLGIYLGDLFNGALESYNVETKEVRVLMHTNPAIYVPDLKKIVWGAESWWGVIESEDKLRSISDFDIQNIWYVRALKDFEAQAPTNSTSI